MSEINSHSEGYEGSIGGGTELGVQPNAETVSDGTEAGNPKSNLLAELQTIREQKSHLPNRSSDRWQQLDARERGLTRVIAAQESTSLGKESGSQSSLETDHSEQQRSQRLEAIKAKLANQNLDELPEEEFLTIIGVLANGRFSFPQDLASRDTIKLWRHYLQNVSDWSVAVGAVHGHNDAFTNTELAALDKIRTRYHDDVSQALVNDLAGIVSFDEARRMVAKMRDEAIPNSGELSFAKAQKAKERVLDKLYTEQESENAA